ncbi:hypothetical protein [Acrocarpospora pleiomorpha]|uniref:hypothetical protein n=1 Tax=Acrocarpospora pleiomorpha TaxID=90975 RepID=UPI0012D33E6F|nr:hypothetical protein [Acrocarpospora pleiomorpha]
MAVALGLLLSYADTYWGLTPVWLAITVTVIVTLAPAPTLIRLVYAVPRIYAKDAMTSPQATSRPMRLVSIVFIAWAVLQRIK